MFFRLTRVMIPARTDKNQINTVTVIQESITKGKAGSKRLRNYIVPVLPKRCDHLRYRLSGTGDVKIYSISRTEEVGSDVN